jgi:16S rRNA (adenine1518-N6/adenine1519-N6)-dimethyltransferase
MNAALRDKEGPIVQINIPNLIPVRRCGIVLLVWIMLCSTVLLPHRVWSFSVSAFGSRGLCYKRKYIRKARPAPVRSSNGDDAVADRPYTLPPGIFRPKQSLGQNFLSDQNTIVKICNRFEDHSEDGLKVIEIGPGAGALTRVLYPRYPSMTVIEIDQRAVKFLTEKLPGLNIIHQDVLLANWSKISAERGGRLNIIGNLPYNIVSQVLFTMADSPSSINKAVLTMQLEVADRLIAKPKTKDYGIPSVVFQLYTKVNKEFHIPPSVFYPKPDVDSALVTLDFNHQNPDLKKIDTANLRRLFCQLASFRYQNFIYDYYCL